MPFQPAPGVVRAELIWLVNGEICENVLHFFDAATAIDEGFLSNMADTLSDSIGTNLMPLLSAGCTLTQIRLTELTSDQGVQFVLANPLTGGNNGATVAPTYLAALVRLLTAWRGRGKQGRMFVTGLAENNFAGNVLEPTFVPLLQAAIVQIIADVSNGVAAMDLAVLERVDNEVELNPAVAHRVIGVSVKPQLSSQSSRMPGRHRHKRPATP